LEKKLKLNIQRRRTEREVIEEFATKQGDVVDDAQENTDDENDNQNDEDEKEDAGADADADAATQDKNKTYEDNDNVSEAEYEPEAGEEPLFEVEDSDDESEHGLPPVSDLSAATSISITSSGVSQVLSRCKQEAKSDTLDASPLSQGGVTAQSLSSTNNVPIRTNMEDSAGPLPKRARVDEGTS